MAAKFLIEAEETADAERRDEKRNRETRRVAGQKKNSLTNGFARGRDCEHARKDGSDAGRPTKCESKAHKKSAEGSGLAAEFAEVDIAIEPTRERGAEKKNQRDGKEMNRP